MTIFLYNFVIYLLDLQKVILHYVFILEGLKICKRIINKWGVLLVKIRTAVLFQAISVSRMTSRDKLLDPDLYNQDGVLVFVYITMCDLYKISYK